MNNQLSNEDQATQRTARRQAARANRLQSDGLRRLREGRAPTKAQLPFVQQWLIGHDNEIVALKGAVASERAEKDYIDSLYRRLIPQYNAVFDALCEFGIRCYTKADDNHGWEGEVHDIKGGQEGYDGFEEALRAALQWRIQQGRDKE
jgi:predicted alpha-1,6-mannanase (GH76 family)